MHFQHKINMCFLFSMSLTAACCLPAQGAEQTKAPDETYKGEYVVTDFGDDAGFACGPNATLKSGVWDADLQAMDSAHLSHSLSLFGKPVQFVLAVKGGAPGNVLRVSIGSHFQTFERVIGALDGGEKEFSFGPPPEGWIHSGAAEDNITLPLRITAVTLERGSGPAAPTRVGLKALRCTTEIQYGRAVTLFSELKESGVSSDTRTFSAVCTAWNLLDKDAAGDLTMTVRDWDDNVLHERSELWTLPAGGRRSSVKWDASVPGTLNFAEAEFRFKADGLHETASRAGYTKSIYDPGDATLRPESPWGMGVYLYRYPHNPDGHALMDRGAALAQAAGVKWTREEFSWAAMEPKQGQFDFSFYDVVVDTARRHGISVYGLLAYWTDWTKPYTEQGIDDFARWARATVHHFKDRVKHWEIYNEPNIFFWEGPKELYPLLVKKCYAAIKEEDPEAQVLAISTAGIERKFIARVLEAGAPFDVLTVHPYRPRLVDKGFMKELQDVAALVGGKPVWITEMGWSTQIGSTDERKQAQLLARSYLCAVASGACQNMSWYDLRNDGNDPFDFESNFGVLRNDFAPKPAYRALATVCRTLASGAPSRVNKLEEDGVFIFRMGGATAVWTADKNVSIRCSVSDGVVRALNLMGEEIKLGEKNEKRFEVRLRAGCPIFLIGEKVRVRKIEKTP